MDISEYPLFVELIGGGITALITFVIIWWLRPKVKISPHIAMVKKNDKITYQIKVINKSQFFQLIDIHFELTMLKPVQSPKGMNINVKKVQLKSDYIWFLSRRKGKISRFFSKDVYATYAITIAVNDDFDLLNTWKKELETKAVYYDFKVISKNNFSGITSITHEKYNHPSCIKNGEFCHGNNLNIIE